MSIYGSTDSIVNLNKILWKKISNLNYGLEIKRLYLTTITINLADFVKRTIWF